MEASLNCHKLNVNISDALSSVGVEGSACRTDEKEKTILDLQEQLLRAQKMEAIGVLTSSIAHEFRNYINAALLFLEACPTQDANIQSAIALIRRAGKMVKQILMYGRKQDTDLEVLNMNMLIGETVNLFRAILPANIRIKTEFSNELNLVNVDTSQMEQVLANLLINARDAINDMGEIVIRTSNIYVSQEILGVDFRVDSGDYVLIEFSDNGTGVEKKILDKIFVSACSTKRRGEGTGLGLSIIFEIVKRHRGYIVCQSQENIGTRFMIYLPIHRSQDCHQINEAQSLSVRFVNKKRIILVDDEVAILSIMKRILESADYVVDVFSSGLKAIEFYEQNSKDVDLVILDFNIPDLNGFRCLERLRELNPEVKIIFLSGQGKGDLTEEARARGALDVLEKPITKKELLSQIVSFLS